MKPLLLLPLLFFAAPLSAQQNSSEKEFPQEWITHLRVHSGAMSTVGATPQLFVGGLQLTQQVTLVKHKLRGGVAAGGFFVYKKIHGLFGPTLSVKLMELRAGYVGTGGNLHISIEHLWGTGKQHLLGGGFNADVLNKVVLSLLIHRDYNLQNWWYQSGIAFRISKVKQEKETFPQ